MKLKILLALGLLLLLNSSIQSQTVHKKKTVLQAFWWDYKNNHFPNSWANYLVDLAPRLRQMGVDAVWIPPTIKNQDFGEKGVGYAPFDHYDLGDKFQKNDATTRVGTKDELLRMIAVLHANGIEVIQDIVPNHVIGAGSDNGGGGLDPQAPEAPCTDKWKNFRYSSWDTPALDNSASLYLSKNGRWHKNHQNFHPIIDCNFCNLCDPNDNPICWQGFGPDISYDDCAYGYSSNATYNPDQTTYSPYLNGGIGNGNGYMRKNMREWLVWYKKQSGFNGVRIDAVKHFPNEISEDLLFNLQNMAGWASGSDTMFAVGEWVGNTNDLDAWSNAVLNRAGTFDFNLRAFDNSGGLRGMIYGNGGFNMSNLPGAQQNVRYIDISNTRIHRTVPFVNNHDTYRPQTDGMGNITGWNSGDELSEHVDIREPRLAAAYAVMHAMDGNPQSFFEDVFNIANTGKRWIHQPTNLTDLPVNSDLANIIKMHGALDFKSGNYKVPSNLASFWNLITSSNNNSDIIVIERSAKAIVCATDSWNVDQDVWIDTDFAVGTVLKDYSGGVLTTTTVQTPENSGGPNRVNVKCKAVGYPSFNYSTNYSDHGAHYHGYAIWAPLSLEDEVNNYERGPITTTQEWEMEDDLGDSHCESLVQGGRLPENSCSYRIVGKIFPDLNSTVNYEFYEDIQVTEIDNCIEFYYLNGQKIHCNCGIGDFTGSFVLDSLGWVVAKIRHNPGDGCNQNYTCGQNVDCGTFPSQKAYIKLIYNAPAILNSNSFPALPNELIPFWTGVAEDNDYSNPANWEKCHVPPLKEEKRILFVKQNATGLNNGSSWQNAYTSLDNALKNAEFCEEIDEIWVAEGTYKPDTDDNRQKSFLLSGGLRIYGGFPSIGDPNFNQRNVDTHVTILSADIGVTSVQEDNSYHVVIMPLSIDTTILDGFSLRYGYADGTSGYQAKVGGLLNLGKLKASNLNISECYASEGPSAILNTGSSAYLEISNIRTQNLESPLSETVKNEDNAILKVLQINIIKE